MDFSTFDNRGPAEAGQRLVLLDPRTPNGEPVTSGKKECAVIVRGTTARSVQIEIRNRTKARIANGKADDAERIMEDVHAELCDAAAPLIVGFENVERGGKPLTTSPEDVAWFLDLTFPIMVVKKLEDGQPDLGKDGAIQFEMANNPFAKQIGEFSSKQVLALGNAPKP